MAKSTPLAIMFLWSSGYDVAFTLRRSLVQSQPGIFLFTHLVGQRFCLWSLGALDEEGDS